jgi:hypothetical protein
LLVQSIFGGRRAGKRGEQEKEQKKGDGEEKDGEEKGTQLIV